MDQDQIKFGIELPKRRRLTPTRNQVKGTSIDRPRSEPPNRRRNRGADLPSQQFLPRRLRRGASRRRRRVVAASDPHRFARDPAAYRRRRHRDWTPVTGDETKEEAAATLEEAGKGMERRRGNAEGDSPRPTCRRPVGRKSGQSQGRKSEHSPGRKPEHSACGFAVRGPAAGSACRGGAVAAAGRGDFAAGRGGARAPLCRDHRRRDGQRPERRLVGRPDARRHRRASAGSPWSRNRRRPAGWRPSAASEVFVDLGGREQGCLPLRQFDTPPNPGDVLQVVVQKLNPDDGLYELRLPDKAVEVGRLVRSERRDADRVQVTGHNTGGLECEINHIRGFIPVSQVALYRVEDLAQFVGQRMTCIITEANPARRNLVLSRRAVLEREKEEAREKFLDIARARATSTKAWCGN